jgi:MacB-like protein
LGKDDPKSGQIAPTLIRQLHLKSRHSRIYAVRRKWHAAWLFNFVIPVRECGRRLSHLFFKDHQVVWLRKMLMNTIWQDLRYGARILLKKPGFTLVAALTLGLGIGANTAVLSTVNGFIIRPLPVDRPEELVQPFWGSRKDPEVWNNFSYLNYIDLRDQNKVFSGLLAWQMISAGISDSASRSDGAGARAEIIWGEVVSGNYFDVLGVKMALGRAFLPDEDRTVDTHPVVVLGNVLWQRRFNSDPGIVGRTVYLNSNPFKVVGVAPPSFEGVKYAIRQDFWVPLMMQTALGAYKEWPTNRGVRNLNLLGRLKTGVTMKQAEADLHLYHRAGLRRTVPQEFEPSPERRPRLQRREPDYDASRSGPIRL